MITPNIHNIDKVFTLCYDKWLRIYCIRKRLDVMYRPERFINYGNGTIDQCTKLYNDKMKELGALLS